MKMEKRIFNCVIIAYKSQVILDPDEIDTVEKYQTGISVQTVLCNAKDEQQAREIVTAIGKKEYLDSDEYDRIGIGVQGVDKEKLRGLLGDKLTVIADDNDLLDSEFLT